MTRAQIHLVNNHLTTQLLEKLPENERALLERLCTESIYHVKDDFDRGLDPNRWYVENMELADHEFGGVVYSTSPAGDNEVEQPVTPVGERSLLRSRLAGWVPNRRATFQTRANLSGTGSHIELGFVKEGYEGQMVATPDSSSVLRRGARSFGVALRSANISGWFVASGGTDGTAFTATTTRVAETGWSTFLVATNEQGETRLWVNGQHNNEFARRTDMHVTQEHYLWVNVARGSLALDYIEAWQERSPL